MHLYQITKYLYILKFQVSRNRWESLLWYTVDSPSRHNVPTRRFKTQHHVRSRNILHPVLEPAYRVAKCKYDTFQNAT